MNGLGQRLCGVFVVGCAGCWVVWRCCCVRNWFFVGLAGCAAAQLFFHSIWVAVSCCSQVGFSVCSNFVFLWRRMFVVRVRLCVHVLHVLLLLSSLVRGFVAFGFVVVPWWF